MKDKNKIIEIDEFDYDDTISDNDLYFEDLYNNKLNDIFSKKQETDEIYEYKSLSSSWDEAEERFKIDKEVVDKFIENIGIDVKIKKIYACVLLIILSLQLISVNVIFVLKGLGILKYTDSTFNIFVAGALIEVIALVAIVVRYLFKDNISKSLNNILEKNKSHK